MKKILNLCVLVASGFSTVVAQDVSADKSGDEIAKFNNFASISGGYLSEFEVPYYSFQIGSEVGGGNIYFQLLGFSGDKDYDYGNDDFDFISYSVGYTHYFPVSDKGAFFLGASLGGVTGNVDWSYEGTTLDSLQGNAFYTDANIGFEHAITDRLIFNIKGKMLWMGDFHDGGGTDNGVQYEWIYEHENVYFGVEAGLSYRF